jgi:DNA-binding HxlR family transcriptional regulator
MRKTNSSNYLNEQEILSECPISTFFHLFGGRWKLSVLYNLDRKPRRFSELKGRIMGISDKMLTQQLKSLQEMGFVEREVLNETPVKVSYHLSEKGKALIPILEQIYTWGIENDIVELNAQQREGAI